MSIYRTEAGEAAVAARYREVLRAWPVPHDHVRVPTREGDTFVVVSGPTDAPPVVMLHGSGSNAGAWGPDMAAWAQRHRTYAVDLIGEPGLSAPSRPDLNSDAVAAWLDDVLDGLGVQSAAFVGMSLGGWTALDYAVRRPGRVRALALLCPGGIGRQKYGWMPKALLLSMFGEWGRRRTTREVTGLDVPATADALDDVVLTFRHFRPRTERLPIVSDAHLDALTVPVLAIVGARDVMFDSAETAQRLRHHVPNARVMELPDTGHAVIGCSDDVLAFVTASLAGPNSERSDT